MKEYMKPFVASRNTRAWTALYVLALVIPFCRTDQFSRPLPRQQNYWSDIEITSTQYNLNITPMCFAAWVVPASVRL